MLDNKSSYIFSFISLIIFSNFSNASVNEFSLHGEYSKNSLIGKYGIGYKYDFNRFSTEGALYTNNENDIELSSYLRLEHELDSNFLLAYGLGYYKDDNNSGLQSKLELGYHFNNSIHLYGYINLREGSELKNKNTWFGLGLRWYPFTMINESKQNLSNNMHNQQIEAMPKEEEIIKSDSKKLNVNAHEELSSSREVKIVQYGAFSSQLNNNAIVWLSNVAENFHDQPLKVYEFTPGKPVLAILCSDQNNCKYDREMYNFFKRYQPFMTFKLLDDKTLIMDIDSYISHYNNLTF